MRDFIPQSGISSEVRAAGLKLSLEMIYLYTAGKNTGKPGPPCSADIATSTPNFLKTDV